MSALLDNFWILLVLKVVLIAAVVPGVALVFIFAELKISAHMQSRIGPYFAGGRWGWAQPLADGLKFMQKEDLVPADADTPVFKFAPMVVLISTWESSMPWLRGPSAPSACSWRAGRRPTSTR